ncbi:MULTISPECIES: integrase [unclassified Archaeoglobus]|uniref:integrase n=1 Tax=unclassified Archaeoglobus TaxID=2643606 RepID=UPI0025C2112D|nr:MULTISPECIES: integrase [unclassified Archaeoglobus]
MRVELDIDDRIYHEVMKRKLDLKTFLEIKLYEYFKGIDSYFSSFKSTFYEIRDDFEKWLKERMSEETANRYITILENLSEISEDSIIELYRTRPTNNVAKALRNLVNYLLEKEVVDERTASRIKKRLPIKKGNGDKVIPTDDDIKEAFKHYSNLDEPYYLVALILLYSGARLRHVLRMLEEWDPKYLEANGSFAKYEIGHFTKGNKEGFYIYMPVWLAGKLRRMSLSEETVKSKKITYKASSGRPVTAKYIRKWFNNLLADICPDKDVRNFIMGRPGEIEKSVESEYYLELKRRADKVYKLVLENFPIDIVAQPVPVPRNG